MPGANLGDPAADRHLYRSNPRFVLREPDDLDLSRNEILVGSTDDLADAALLVRRGDADFGAVKAVSASTAGLFRQVAVPTWLPSPLWPDFDREDLGDLIGAEVLEIQIGGQFLTGVEALAELHQSPLQPPEGRLAALSLDGVAYAELLRLDDPAVLANRLYAFHRVAIRSSWRSAEFGDAFRARMGHAMPHGLGADPRWVEVRHRPWRAYRRRDAPERAELPTPKLYISPKTDCLAGVVAASIPLIRESPEVLGWKVANTVEAMVRPDKFVVYLTSPQGLQELAATLSSALAGAAIHGVPFTCDAGLGGLLSWGIDPAAEQLTASRVESWRTWIVARLADGLIQARRAGLTGRPAHAAALRRVRAAGVDTSTWRPIRASAGAFE